TGGLSTTGSALALAGSVPPDDAFQVRKLRQAGAIILGKTNLHELASGITTISSLGGQTLNPYDPTRNPGGSSGGTGAAIAASFAAIGWGSDTCGSIRIPSAHNALFGLRPTKGLSSVDGVIPLSHSQDVAGPLARTVADLAIGLDATIGPDSADPATAVLRGRALPHFVGSLRPDALRGVRLGMLTSYFGAAAEDREVGDIVRRALERMEALGASVVVFGIPRLDSLVAGTALINHEFKFDLQDYLARTPAAPVGSLDEILARGLHHSALDAPFRARNAAPARETDAYRHARAKRDTLHATVLQRMDAERIDAIVYPTIRRKPARIGEPQSGSTCQLSASTGMPALSAPAGFTRDSLPVGIELLGRRFDDARLVAMAYAYEQAVKPRKPPRTTPPLSLGAPRPVTFEATAVSGKMQTRARFTFDPFREELAYSVRVTGTAAERLHAVVLQRDTAGQGGSIVARLNAPGSLNAEGRLSLTSSAREELRAGKWSLLVFTADYRGTPAARARLVLSR
ncbi:MAG TPA: amidase family protein, partial [Longimicrobiales bacterium]|nr:amidase family protein [Longimicrobiales bacterium]